LFIRSFIYSKINTFSLSKFSKLSFAFNIFVPIPVQEMVYLKAIQKSTPIGVSVSGTIGQKTNLKKFRGASAPLAPPLDPPMYRDAYLLRGQPSCCRSACQSPNYTTWHLEFAKPNQSEMKVFTTLSVDISQ